MSLFSLKLNKVYDATITSLENEGGGVCKINSMVVFVPKSLVGEKVRVQITEIKKKYARAKLLEVIEKSDSRVNSNCPYYNECGGCNLRHQDYNTNLSFKKNKVELALNKIGKINITVDDVIPSVKVDNYRNKASFKVEKDKIGFYKENTYQLIDIDNCLLLEKEINNTLNVIRKYIKKNPNNDIYNITIKYGNAFDEILIDVSSKKNSDSNIVDYLINNVKRLKTLIYNDKIVFGNGYISQMTNDLLFKCSSKSFFQVNSLMQEKLYYLAIKNTELSKEDILLDLYCGTGTISIIASNHVKKVIGIEINSDAVCDAINNAKLNRINNVKFICGNANKEISKITEKIDVIFVDPPRGGLDRKTIAFIKKINPKKITYISCNPITLARDLSYFNDLYDIKKVIPVDMFPNTSHVECVCVLKLR